MPLDLESPLVTMLQEDDSLHGSVVIESVAGPTATAPDFDPDYVMSLDAQIRSAAVDEAILVQRADAGQLPATLVPD